MELPELRRRVRQVPAGQMPNEDVLRGLKQRVSDFGFGPTGNHLKLSGDTLKHWLTPPTPIIPLDVRPVSNAELKTMRLALMNFPRGASASLLASRAGMTTTQAENVLAELMRSGQVTVDLGKYRFTVVTL